MERKSLVAETPFEETVEEKDISALDNILQISQRFQRSDLLPMQGASVLVCACIRQCNQATSLE